MISFGNRRCSCPKSISSWSQIASKINRASLISKSSTEGAADLIASGFALSGVGLFIVVRSI
jgi:hypothetical protein